MRGKTGSVEKSKSLKIASNGTIEKLLTSDKLEDIKLACELVKARDDLRKIDYKYQQDRYTENQRQAEYHKAGYGHILSDKYQMPISVRAARDKFLDSSNPMDDQALIALKRTQAVTTLLTTSMMLIGVLGLIVYII